MAVAQDTGGLPTGGGGLPTGGGATGGLEDQIIDQVNNAGGPTDTVDTDLSDVFGDLGNIGQVIETTPDARDQRFVGVTSTGEIPDNRVPFRHIGPTRESIGLGDINPGAPGARATGQGGRGGGAGGGTTNGFRVQRVQSIRSRIVPRFQSRPLASDFVSSRFNQRLSTLPAVAPVRNSIRVSMQGRTAIISGTAQTQQQVDRIRRQLRLEPGVSKIEVRTSVVQ